MSIHALGKSLTVEFIWPQPFFSKYIPKTTFSQLVYTVNEMAEVFYKLAKWHTIYRGKKVFPFCKSHLSNSRQVERSSANYLKKVKETFDSHSGRCWRVFSQALQLSEWGECDSGWLYFPQI